MSQGSTPPFELVTDPAVKRNFDRIAGQLAILNLLAGFRIVRGIVTGTGTAAITEGTGFTLVDNGTGDYTLTFDPAFTDVPAVVGNVEAASLFVRVESASATATTLFLIDRATGNKTDGKFHFIAIGPA